MRNAQGDIIKLVDSYGDTRVEYTYDAWGKVTSITGDLAATYGEANPFRYKGYYYDTETGLYYLNSRYYNPEWGRFISADSFLGTGSLLSHNLFAYCNNNPVMLKDNSGYSGEAETLGGIWTFALAEPTPFGEIFAVFATIVIGVIIIDNAPSISTDMSLPYSTSVSLPLSSKINWGINDNTKHHILNGSFGRHINGWKKFGIDPNSSGAWEKLLPFLKLAVDQYDDVTSIPMDGGMLRYYYKYFADEGVTIVVKVWETLRDGFMKTLSDAWPE